jgi:diketogulonate reductase-like aldo/keto reductase
MQGSGASLDQRAGSPSQRLPSAGGAVDHPGDGALGQYREMQRRRLGRTNHESSVAILGGAAFWDATPDEAAAGFQLALDRGVNHLDIAPQYGAAEDVVGPLVPAVRDRLFVACKTLRKSPDGVRAQLEDSLRKLGTDHFDLYQLHGVTGLDELETRVAAAGAILAARDEGLVRHVGITGHDLGAPAAHLEALRRWDLDTVMFPVFPRVWADPPYRRDAEALLEECVQRDVGVMAIKAVAREPWGDRELTAGTWYAPHTDPDAITRSVRFTLSVPGVHAFCTPGDLGLLPVVLDAAERYEPMDSDEREAMVGTSGDLPLIFPLVEHARRA